MRGRGDSAELINSTFAQIALWRLPRAATQVVGIVGGHVVVAPICGVLDSPCACNCGLETSRLRDETVRHVTAVAVAADREMVRIGDTVLHERINTSQNVFARSRNEFWNNSLPESITIANGPTIVRLEDKPAVAGRQPVPLIPIHFKVISVGVVRTAMDQREHGKILGAKSSGRVEEHAFNFRAVVGGPLVALALRKIALGEELVERGDGTRLLELVRRLRQVHLSRAI